MLINSKFYHIPLPNEAQNMPDTIRLVVFTPITTLKNEELLTKMLQSTGLQKNEFIHIMIKNEVISVKSFAKIRKALKIISFNCEPSSLGLQVTAKRYEPFHIHSTEIVLVDDLESIGAEIHLKKYIWNLFKRWFVNQEHG
jgi:hypothetical protein